MHELSLCANIVEILEEQAVAQRFRRVLRVRLAIGQLSCVEPDALHFAFDVVSCATIAEGAALEIEQVPGRGHCKSCNREVALPERFTACEECGAFGLVPCGGTEMTIRNIEIE